jgi:glutaredoxin-like YruB-family protein
MEDIMAICIYSTPSCSYCTLAKDYFRKQKIPFTEYNVAEDKNKANEMLTKSGQMGVPVLDINGRILVGFNPAEIDKALHR